MIGGRPGIRGLCLSDYCDIAWAMLYDDCPAMGDQHKYREALHNLFYLGTETETYDIIGADGKKRTLTRPKPVSIDPHSKLPSSALKALEQLRSAVEDAGGSVGTPEEAKEE